MTLKEQILQLREQGLNYNQIRDKLNCSKGTIAYHLNQTTKIKTRKRAILYKLNNPLQVRLSKFYSHKYKPKKDKISIRYRCNYLLDRIYDYYRRNKLMSAKITVEQLMEKYKDGFKCYLTGKEIDITNGKTYEFDHIIPASRGGDNSLDNLGICTPEANQAKRNLTVDEFINLCKDVLEYQGYKITK